MTDHHHPGFQVPERDRPTRAQLRCLRSLALQTGRSFATPRTKTRASQEIARLSAAARERKGESDGCCADERDGARAYATAIREDEITGYGSTARWG